MPIFPFKPRSAPWFVAVIHGIPDSEKQLIKILPRKIKSTNALDNEKEKLAQQINKRSLGLLTGLKRRRMKNRLKKLSTKKINTMRRGADGEIRAVNVLRKLPRDYHVMCGIDIRLSKYIAYGGTVNLRSAQMDIVVVGPTGMFVLEVKNWTDSTNAHKQTFTPHEQSSRAATVLSCVTRLPVGAVVVDIQGNIERANRFKAVVCGLADLNATITKKRRGAPNLTKKGVSSLVKRIKRISK